MKTRKLNKKEFKKSKSRRNKKYGGQPKIQSHLLMRDTPERATIFILMPDYEKEIFEYRKKMIPYYIYDTSERMHNLPELNNEAHKIQLKEYWNEISREVGIRLFIFYGTITAFDGRMFTDKIPAIVASDIKPLVCILLGCRTSEIAYALNQAHNKDSCYFIGINEMFKYHKYDKTGVLCRDASLLNKPITELVDIYGERENFMEEFTTRRCKMLKRDNVVQFLMEIKPITNGPQISKAGKVIKNTGVLGRDKSYFSSSRLATITDVSDLKDADYERRYKEWLDKMLIRHIEYENGDVYDGYAYWDFYVGIHLKWIKQGPGKMRYANGDVYEGNWNYDMLDWGKMTYSDGSVYDGKWFLNDREGRGKMTYSDGTIYEGEWENDEPKR